MVETRVILLKEHQMLRFSSYFVLCVLDDLHDDFIYSRVSLITQADVRRNKGSVRLYRQGRPDIPVNYPPAGNTKKKIKGEIALCVKPLHNEFDAGAKLVEFIEFYRLLGVKHFFFYNHTIGEKVQRIIRHYKTVFSAIVTIANYR